MAECFERTGIEMLPGDCDAHRSASFSEEVPGQRANSRPDGPVAALSESTWPAAGWRSTRSGASAFRLGDLDGAATAFQRTIARVGHVGSALGAFEQLWRDRVAQIEILAEDR